MYLSAVPEEWLWFWIVAHADPALRCWLHLYRSPPEMPQWCGRALMSVRTFLLLSYPQFPPKKITQIHTCLTLHVYKEIYGEKDCLLMKSKLQQILNIVMAPGTFSPPSMLTEISEIASSRSSLYLKPKLRISIWPVVGQPAGRVECSNFHSACKQRH